MYISGRKVIYGGLEMGSKGNPGSGKERGKSLLHPLVVLLVGVSIPILFYKDDQLLFKFLS